MILLRQYWGGTSGLVLLEKFAPDSALYLLKHWKNTYSYAEDRSEQNVHQKALKENKTPPYYSYKSTKRKVNCVTKSCGESKIMWKVMKHVQRHQKLREMWELMSFYSVTKYNKKWSHWALFLDIFITFLYLK